MATVKSHVYDDKMVHAIYSDVVEEALTAGITAEEIIAEMEEAPAIKELRALSTYCREIKAGEDAGKFTVRAVLRYVPASDESESM